MSSWRLRVRVTIKASNYTRPKVKAEDVCQHTRIYIELLSLAIQLQYSGDNRQNNPSSFRLNPCANSELLCLYDVVRRFGVPL